ncbi:MAG: carboxypeptidase-like regulatory domain-containing protein [Cyclobacteriaceae bacterium]
MEVAFKPRAVLLLLLSTVATSLYSQITSKSILSGVVVDSETMEPLPYAHVILNGKLFTQPNSQGMFFLPMNAEDTLTISHIGYRSEQKIIEVAKDIKTLSVAIFLAKDITLLEAIEVTPMPATEASFKQAVLEMEIGPKLTSNMEKQHMQITFDMIMGPKVSYDAYENYRGIGQSKGFTLFSSGPNKGILRAIKSFKSKKKEKSKN